MNNSCSTNTKNMLFRVNCVRERTGSIGFGVAYAAFKYSTRILLLLSIMCFCFHVYMTCQIKISICIVYFFLNSLSIQSTTYLCMVLYLFVCFFMSPPFLGLPVCVRLSIHSIQALIISATLKSLHKTHIASCNCSNCSNS